MNRFAFVLAAASVVGCGQTGPIDCPSKLRPSPRSGAAAALVPATGEIFMIGGTTANGALTDELWRWSSGACGGWLPLALTDAPLPRTGAAALFDPSRHRLIVLGGGSTGGVQALDTDRLQWSQLQPSGGGFTGRPTLAVYDGARDQVVDVTVGVAQLSFANIPAGEWHFLDVMPPLPDRPPASIALDPTRSAIFELDSAGLHAFSLLVDSWRDVAVTGDLPAAGATLLWDDTRRRLLAVGDGLWAASLDGNGTSATWTLLPTTGAPVARAGAALVVSGDTLWLWGGRAGGCVYDDLWQVDLNTEVWTNPQPATSCP